MIVSNLEASEKKLQKCRLDIFMYNNNISRSRTRARDEILAGNVLVNGVQIKKPSYEVFKSDQIILTKTIHDFVGRGGVKLQMAIEMFGIDINGKICMDVGASTGGFTQCMLNCGAKRVYALDVGHGQLAPELCIDDRVINLQGINIKTVSTENLSIFPEKADFISVDVSFISLKYVVLKIFELVKVNGQCVVLIKPQFEAGCSSRLNKKGVLKSISMHIEIIDSIMTDFASYFEVKSLIKSPIKGGDGNIEYLLYVKRSEVCGKNSYLDKDMIKKIVLDKSL